MRARALPADRANHRAALLDRYCVTCHNERLKTAGLALDSVDIADVVANAPVLEKVVRKLRSGQMPPEGRPRPDPATVNAFATTLETGARPGGGGRAQPGRVVVRRLNRAEYVNAIHDLLALDIDGPRLLPDRQFGLRLRQHRGRAHDRAGVDGALHVGGDQDQPPGRGQSGESAP